MPLYTFRHHQTGATREVSRRVEERNDPLPDDPLHLWRRDIEAPGVVGTFRELPTLAQKMIDAHYQLEQKEQSRYRSGFSKSHNKRTWETCRAAEVAGLRATKGDDVVKQKEFKAVSAQPKKQEVH
jgi:hypothetical protein